MEIDGTVEPLVREALTAVVKRDPDRFAAAVAAFPDGEAIIKGMRLATALSLYALSDHYGRTPTNSEIQAVAAKLVEMEHWTDVTSSEVVATLQAAINNTPADEVLPMERTLIVAYVSAGNLLSSAHRDDEKWWDFLNRAEAAIEATPDSQ